MQAAMTAGLRWSTTFFGFFFLERDEVVLREGSDGASAGIDSCWTGRRASMYTDRATVQVGERDASYEASSLASVDLTSLDRLSYQTFTSCSCVRKLETGLYKGSRP
jgi:hypothetical protein